MIDISLIVVTLGRYEEVERLLTSLSQQTIDRRRLEVIIVDQNDSIDLTPIIAIFSKHLTISHIRSTTRGIAFSRNKGLAIARGGIVAFPDDDCTYYADTLERVLDHYQQEPESVLLLGSVYDRNTHQPVIRRWPKHAIRATAANVFFLYSSITIFSRLRSLSFDERLGAGAPYGSYEDADYVFRALQYGPVQYSPAIQVWHSDLNAHLMPPAKIRAYGVGFGAFVAKHLTIYCIAIFIMALGYHVGMAVKSALFFDAKNTKAHCISITSRISGAVSFLVHES
jgi:glycosyltransferase involved in cell wall biosynthesis